jgi:acetyltransferase-like isoleucine patch superfamily enzyme
MMSSSNAPDERRFLSDNGIHLLIKRMKRFSGNSLHDNLSLLSSAPARIASALYYPRIFGSFGQRSLMQRPLLIQNPQFIHIGSGVLIRDGIRMQSFQTNPNRIPQLRIGDGTSIEQFNHIICHNRVIIGSNVALAPMCGILDAAHPWMESTESTNPTEQVVDDDGFVEIGDSTLVGMGTIILPNVRIGKGCVIGANSVVTSDIPDYSVAAGAPARVIRTHAPVTTPESKSL